MNKQTSRSILVSITLTLVLVAVMSTGLQAAPAEKLPPRPTVKARQVPRPQPRGGLITLIASPMAPGLWTEVQWEGQPGAWYDVDGWRGHFNRDELVTWWVAQDDLGTGPFRWLIYESEGGELLAISDLFDLPAAGGAMVTVKVSLTP